MQFTPSAYLLAECMCIIYILYMLASSHKFTCRDSKKNLESSKFCKALKLLKALKVIIAIKKKKKMIEID